MLRGGLTSDRLLFCFSGIKKPAPGIPRTVLLEPYESADHESACRVPELVKCRIRAFGDGDQGPGEVQAEHFHEALGIHLIGPLPTKMGKDRSVASATKSCTS